MEQWYFFYIEECVLCGHQNKWKELRLGPKPQNREDRYSFRQIQCCQWL